MNLVNINDLSVQVGDKDLFCKVSLGINEGDKIGIIGANGMGKSTLLRIISGEFYDYTGEITKARGITINYLPQAPAFDENKTVIEYVRDGGKLETWDREPIAKNILMKLEINDFSQKISELSGGQKKRIALAKILIEESDVLILDEPTNHLDHFMIEWLEQYLQSYKGVLIMVTHDRYFLDCVTNKIVEIDSKALYEYHCNYEGFLKLKCEREEMKLASERKRESIIRNELKWVMRGAKARTTKQKSRLQRFEQMKSIEKIPDKKSVTMESVTNRMGKKTIELSHVSVAYNNRIIISDFNYIFLKDSRIGIVGKNGCGKTSLLNVITGNLKSFSGDVVIGDTIRIGYFSQHNESMDEHKRVIDYITDIAEYLPTENGRISASQMLERFLFEPKMQYAEISKLSGGEKRRLYLLKVLMEAPNVLILDEPTNDLDIMTLATLEDFLDSFKGIVIAVSHDRYFLDRTVSRILAFEEDGQIKEYMGSYSDYHSFVSEKLLLQNDKTTKTEKKKNEEVKKKIEKPKNNKLKFSYNEQREYDIIEDEICALEDEIKEIDKVISQQASNFIKLNELMKMKNSKEQQLAMKMDRWVYLSDLAAQINEQRNV